MQFIGHNNANVQFIIRQASLSPSSSQGKKCPYMKMIINTSNKDEQVIHMHNCVFKYINQMHIDCGGSVDPYDSTFSNVRHARFIYDNADMEDNDTNIIMEMNLLGKRLTLIE